MATWITHLMIADGVLERISNLNKRGFCVGNIAPDCNVENEDWTAFEKYAGHIGYSVRPSARRKRYAKEMLKAALPFCREIGLAKVLISCIDGNVGSEKTILANGGVYESTVHEPNEDRDLKRFWIEL
jgi:predicted acetyltransferase